MTLVLTELTNAGIVMAADSAITKIQGGKIVEVDQEGWSKLLPVPSIKAAVSYWGMIGAVTRIRFDDWLNRVISSGGYSDLSSFADCLVDALNKVCHNRPLADGQAVGIHVAGYAEWADGQKRPFLYHVHNGHLAIEIKHELANSGGQQQIVAVHPKLVSDPRKLFEKHQDFPYHDSLDRSLQELRGGHITRNGDYFFML